jgi:glutamyl-tRNA reductase
MNTITPIDISNFFVAGINYKKTDAATRGQFAISTAQYENILKLAHSFQIASTFILSTCNRTEIYGFAENASQLIGLLCTQTPGAADVFTKLAYVKNGEQAAAHLFNVGAGLDSQILGDYEIIGQLKQAFKFSKDRGFTNCFMERLFNNVLQSSKVIKNETDLSAGTVSVSFAAMQYIKEHVPDVKNKNVLILGTGKIGRNTCKNMVDYLGTTKITMMNRSVEKAAALAAELNLKYAPFNELDQYVKSSDIILVATNALEPLIFSSQLENSGNKLLVDLSIPCNVEPSAQTLPNITLVNIDQLSEIKDKTLLARESEMPKANEIIKLHLAMFAEWCQLRKSAPTLNAIKTTLTEINNKTLHSQPGSRQSHCPVMNAADKIQKVVNNVAQKMRTQHQTGCHYIEAINEFMGAGA